MKIESTKDVVRSFTEKEARDLCAEYIDLRQKILDYLFNECEDIHAVTGCPVEYLINDHRELEKRFSKLVPSNFC